MHNYFHFQTDYSNFVAFVILFDLSYVAYVAAFYNSNRQ